jgi:integrase
MATIRRRGDTWQAQVRKAGAAPQSRSFPTKAAAKRWATRIENEINDGRARGGTAATGTLGDLIDRYERDVGPIKPFGRSKANSLKLIKKGLGTVRLRDLTAARIIKFARDRRAAGAGPVTMAVGLSYLGTMLRTARALWQLAIDDSAVRDAREALRMIGLLGRSRQRDRRPRPMEIERLCLYWRNNPRQIIPMAELTEFAIASGMRLGEICRIRWRDLDQVGRTVLIRDRKDPRQKEGNDEIVPLLDVTDYDTLAIIQRQPASEDGRIFPYLEPTVSKLFARACERLKIENLHFHDLRHEATSRLFEAGLRIEQVALITGHKDWKTLQRYTHLRPQHVTAAFPPLGPAATSGRPRRDTADADRDA